MKDHLATREEAIEIGRQMQKQLPALAKNHQPTKSGMSEYTKAIWDFFEKLRNANDWGFSPATPSMRGRVKGEYLTDFSLFDDRLGNRIACESEWGDLGDIRWAFDKLRVVKADVKILIFQFGHTTDNKLPKDISDLLEAGLANFGHHHPGHEFYLFIQFDGEKSLLFLWEPIGSGPYSEREIKIEQVS